MERLERLAIAWIRNDFWPGEGGEGSSLCKDAPTFIPSTVPAFTWHQLLAYRDIVGLDESSGVADALTVARVVDEGASSFQPPSPQTPNACCDKCGQTHEECICFDVFCRCCV